MYQLTKKVEWTVKDKRPININPLTIKLPITALVSIGHRVSGVVVFLMIPLLLCFLSESLRSEQTFQALAGYFQSIGMKVLLWVLVVGFAYHCIAGVRHLLMDCHIGESLRGGRMGSVIVMALSTLFALAAAWWIGGCL